MSWEGQKALLIVGGAQVNPAHRYPWMAALVTTKNSLFCGGALINN
jgi:secreted trypsin-like serine protease